MGWFSRKSESPRGRRCPVTKCGETNPTLGLRCDREPHPPGTAHYQDDGNGVRVWYEPQPSVWTQLAPPEPECGCQSLSS